MKNIWETKVKYSILKCTEEPEHAYFVLYYEL